MTTSPFSDRAVITAAASVRFVVCGTRNRRTAPLAGVGVHHVRTARWQPDADVAVARRRIQRARRRLEVNLDVTVEMVVAPNDSVTEIALRVITSSFTLCTSTRRADPLSNTGPLVVPRDQLVEIGLSHQYAGLLLAGDREPVVTATMTSAYGGRGAGQHGVFPKPSRGKTPTPVISA